MLSPQYVDFPEIGVSVKMVFDANRQLFELICGTTFIGTAATVDEGKTVSRRWLNQLTNA
jgi:hypothetical protein